MNSLFAYLSKLAAVGWKLGGKPHSKPYKRSSIRLATQAAHAALALHIGRI